LLDVHISRVAGAEVVVVVQGSLEGHVASGVASITLVNWIYIYLVN